LQTRWNNLNVIFYEGKIAVMDQPETPAPTMRELAAALKISATTISMALRNHPRVALKTRRQVQAFAREKGYYLNPTITTMMSHVRSSRRAQYRETLGWLNLWERPDHFTNSKCGVEYHRNLWQGALERAGQLGYSLDSFWLSAPDMNGRHLSRILSARSIRGLLIPPIPRSCGHLTLRWDDFSATALSHTIARPQFHRVVPDHHNNIQMILRTLRRRGFRRTGLLIPQRYDERSENRFRSAYYFYQQSLPVKDRIPVLLCPEAFEKNCRAWLKKYRPDAVITLGAFRHLRKIDIGDAAYSKKLGIVLMGYATTDAGFTAVNENPLQIGATAVDHLAAQLNRNERGISLCPQTVLIKGAWVEGRTLPGKQSCGGP
jgi:LacI family transcriptional regulator